MDVIFLLVGKLLVVGEFDVRYVLLCYWFVICMLFVRLDSVLCSEVVGYLYIWYCI